MIKVVYAKVSDFPSETEGLALSEYRLKKLEKIADVHKRRQGIAAELLLNYLIEATFPEHSAPFDLYQDEFGKAHLKDIPLFFSISHSGDYSACAVSDKDIGIDIEAKDTYNENVAKRFFNKEDWVLIEEAADKKYMFAKLWTIKESALKCLGTGLRKPLKNVKLLSETLVKIEPEGMTKHILHQYKEGVHLSICSSDELLDIEIEKFI